MEITKLTDHQLDALCIKRNGERMKGKPEIRIVEVMTNEELASYRINCLEGIAKREETIKRVSGKVMIQIAKETIETLKEYIAYIDSKLDEQPAELNGGLEVIDQFLDIWKTKAFGYYTNLKNRYDELKNGDHELNEENLKNIRDAWGNQKYSDQKIQNILNREMTEWDLKTWKITIENSTMNNFRKSRNKAEMMIVDNMRFGEGYLENVLAGEVDRKKAVFVSKIENKAGSILSADLTIGDNGEINGSIKGENANVNVKTVSAGGYNIQCFHYRMLVKVIK